MAVVVLDPRLNDLVDADAGVERIATGFMFTEGPVWHPRERCLYFSDPTANILYRWTQATGAVVYRQPSGGPTDLGVVQAGSNGNTLDREGRLVTCEHGNRRVSRTNADGSIETLASHYEGKRLNSPNDVICTPNGDIIFTDPPYGLRRPDRSFGEQETPFAGVYRIAAADGSLSLLTDELYRPNGLVLRSDGRLLVDDTDQHQVRAFALGADGRLSGGAVFCDVVHGESVGRPDGMKLDTEGNLYVAANTAEGVWVFDPAGVLLGFIGIDEPPANLAWGGDDRRTLFVTARTSVYSVSMRVAGQPLQVSA